MPKRKFPRLIKGVSHSGDGKKIFNEMEFALLEDTDGTYFFAGWLANGGYVVVPIETQLEAVMLYQMVLEEMKKISDPKRFEDLKEVSLNINTKASWEWIRSRVKNGERVVQSFYNTDSLKIMFGVKLSERIMDFIK